MITIDAAAATTAAMSVGVLGASGVVTVALGSGGGDFDVTEGIISNKGVVFDGTNSTGTLTINQLTASGAATLSVGAGNFSAGAVDVNGAFIRQVYICHWKRSVNQHHSAGRRHD